MPRFAANLGLLFAELPLLARIDAAAACGFKATEFQFPFEVPAVAVKEAAARNKLIVLGINTGPGADSAMFGVGAVPGREQEFDALFAQALDYVGVIGGNAIHVLAGQVVAGDRAAAERTFVANLKRAAALAASRELMLLIEPINTRDWPNYFVSTAEHTADIIAQVGKPNVRMQFDFYHAQIMGDDLLQQFQRYLPIIGHLQCAAVPSRHEPDEGEVNYPAVFAAIDAAGWEGWIGAEYKPRGRTEDGLAWGAPYGLHRPVNQ